MSALVHQVALVSESNRVKLPDMMRVSAALQKQASRDLEPIWEITATVDAFASLEEVPDQILAGAKSRTVRKRRPGAASVHQSACLL